MQGFADLVAGDLDSPEKAVAGRYAKLSVAAESLSEASPNPELESYDAASDSSDSSLQDEVKKASDPITPDVSDSGESLELAPDEIIDLLIQEFGPLAAEGEDEKLIIEADGALLQDVIILASIFQVCFSLLLSDVFNHSGSYASNNSSSVIPCLPSRKPSRPLPESTSD